MIVYIANRLWSCSRLFSWIACRFTICDWLCENPPHSHLPKFQEITFWNIQSEITSLAYKFVITLLKLYQLCGFDIHTVFNKESIYLYWKPAGDMVHEKQHNDNPVWLSLYNGFLRGRIFTNFMNRLQLFYPLIIY